MTLDENALQIRSRSGLLRDLIPIYSFRQAVPNVVILIFIMWLSLSIEHSLVGFLPIVMLGWVFQFVSRPSAMTVSNSQADWLQGILEQQGFYASTDPDGRWHLRGTRWSRLIAHPFIEFVPGGTVTIYAPRDVMESLRTNLDFFEEHAEMFGQGDQPFVSQSTEPEPLPWQAHVPSSLLGTVCVVAWVWHLAALGVDGMSDWGVSAATLSQRRFDTVVLHMFAHGGAIHLSMNVSMLAAIGGVLTSRLGPTPISWARFLMLFVCSGLSGAALYVLLHPAGTVPMLGASGALYGLLGLLIRAPVNGKGPLSVKSLKIRRISWGLVKQNVFLFALLAIMAWSNGTAGGLAWEAHLGGFLFGLLVGPKLLPHAPADRLSLSIDAALISATGGSGTERSP